MRSLSVALVAMAGSWGVLGCAGGLESVSDAGAGTSAVGGNSTGSTSGVAGAGGSALVLDTNCVAPASVPFQSLTFQRGGGGYADVICSGALRALSVVYSESGEFLLSGTRVGDPITDCLASCCSVADYAEEPVEARALSVIEYCNLAALVTALPSDECIVDSAWSCDYVSSIMVTVDAEDHGSNCCGTQADLTYDTTFYALVRLLDALAGAS